MCCLALTQMGLLTSKQQILDVGLISSSISDEGILPFTAPLHFLWEVSHFQTLWFFTCLCCYCSVTWLLQVRAEWFLCLFFFLPEGNGTRPAEMAIKHIGHAIKATLQHSSSLTNFTFPLTLSINLLLFYLPYVLTQHVITVQNTSLLPWHATFACQLSWGTCDQSVFCFFC